MTANEFYILARANLRANPEWRYGQALFNTLWNVRPDLAEWIRGSDVDPFYARGGTGDPRLYKFGLFVNATIDTTKPVEIAALLNEPCAYGCGRSTGHCMDEVCQGRFQARVAKLDTAPGS